MCVDALRLRQPGERLDVTARGGHSAVVAAEQKLGGGAFWSSLCYATVKCKLWPDVWGALLKVSTRKQSFGLMLATGCFLGIAAKTGVEVICTGCFVMWEIEKACG